MTSKAAKNNILSPLALAVVGALRRKQPKRMIERFPLKSALAIAGGVLLAACAPTLFWQTPAPAASPTPAILPTPALLPAEILRAVCEGIAAPEAAAYTHDHAPHPIVSAGDYLLPLPPEWQPQSAAAAELVLCAQEEINLIQTCDYQGGATYKRFAYTLTIRLLEARSAAEVARFTLEGEPPPPCPVVMVVSGNESPNQEAYGQPVETSRVLPYVEPYVTAARILSQPDGQSAFATSLTFSPDSKTLAAGLNNAAIWDLDSGALLHTLQPFPENPSALIEEIAFSPDGKTIAVGSFTDSNISLWDAASGELLGLLPGNSDGVSELAFSPDGRTLAAGYAGGEIVLWDVATGEGLQTLNAWFILELFFSPDGKYLVVGDSSGIGVWDLEAGQQEATRLELEEFPEYIFLAMLPDGQTLASGSCSEYSEYPLCSAGTIQYWDIKTGKIVRAAPLPSLPVEGMAISPGGSRLASTACIQRGVAACEASRITVWDVKTAKAVATFQAAGEISAVAFSPENQWLAASLFNGNLLIFPLPDEGGQ